MLARFLVVCLQIVFFIGTSYGQNIKKVRGEYVYYAPENVSLEEAKHTALSRAQTQALADEFGTVVAQHNATMVQNSGGRSSTDFSSLSSSDVRGEWIETTDGPDFEIAYQQGMLVVKCIVAGKAREITGKVTEFIAQVLRNGTDDRCESYDFINGDDLYMSFRSSADAYLAVYLIDAANTAYCLLPYRSSADGMVQVRANTHYTLFSSDDAAPLCTAADVDEYTMTCERTSETNYIYVISSPNAFTKAVDNAVSEGLPRELSLADFERWLSRRRTQDKDMQVDIKTITVRKE